MPHIRKSVNSAFGKACDRIDDSAEPMSYRAAYIGFFAASVALCGFTVALGASALDAFIFFAVFLLIAIAVARIRAEAGIAFTIGPPTGSSLVTFGGSSQFSSQELVSISLVQVFGSDVRAETMPPQMEAMKIGNVCQIHPRQLTVAIFAGVVVVIISSWISILGLYYHMGAASASVDPWRSSWGSLPYMGLETWIQNPKPTDTAGLWGAAVGLLFTIFLAVMRTRFVWWPFHPIGYALGGIQMGSMDWIWFPIFVGWAAKALSIRFGGIKTFRLALPFFIGLVIGDYVISAVWAILYLIFGIQGYRTFPI
jgi:hypothetical protein